jgi:hypothetical protein
LGIGVVACVPIVAGAARTIAAPTFPTPVMARINATPAVIPLALFGTDLPFDC